MDQHTSEIPTRTLGIDLGDKTSTYCLIDAEGRVVEEGVVETVREALVGRFQGHAPARVVIEASPQCHWVANVLEASGHEVVVANPRHLRMISQSERKCDRNDARLLARIGRVDVKLLHPVTRRNQASFLVRALLSARTQLVGTRTRLINFVRFECKVVGARIPKCEPPCFHRRARTLIPDCLSATLLPLLDVLNDLNERIRGYDKQVLQLCRKEHPATGALRQVPGVGPLISLMYVATIEDPKRFRDSRAIGAYLGLVPRSYQSGDSNPQLRISKAGDGELRHLLVSAASYIMRRASPDCDLKRFGERLARSGSSRDRGRARVAVARKLAALLHRLWLTGEVYDPLYMAKRAS